MSVDWFRALYWLLTPTRLKVTSIQGQTVNFGNFLKTQNITALYQQELKNKGVSGQTQQKASLQVHHKQVPQV